MSLFRPSSAAASFSHFAHVSKLRRQLFWLKDDEQHDKLVPSFSPLNPKPCSVWCCVCSKITGSKKRNRIKDEQRPERSLSPDSEAISAPIFHLLGLFVGSNFPSISCFSGFVVMQPDNKRLLFSCPPYIHTHFPPSFMLLSSHIVLFVT